MTKVDKYNLLLKQVNGLLNTDEPIITNLANVAAAIKQTFSKVSWVGFYFAKESQLFLGPFQGKVACTRILFGKGVCGKVAETLESLVVPNVNEFPGHIACDVESQSEVVVPLLNNSKIYAVLDLDSMELANFDETDKYWLELICKSISNKLELTKTSLV